MDMFNTDTENAVGQSRGLSKAEQKLDAVRRVFEYWKVATKHPKACLDVKRKKLIMDRLTDGYSEESLKLACIGIANCRWNQGENPQHKVYDSIQLLFRCADQVDRFMEEGANAKAREARQIKEKEMMHEANLRASTTGEVYREQRKSLLRIVGK